MSRKKKHEDHVNHEAWAIPYGDLITLLLAFFVVMYAISSVNEGKYRVLSESLVAAFRGAPRSTRPIQLGENRATGTSSQGAETMYPVGMSDPRTLQLPRSEAERLLRQGLGERDRSEQRARALENGLRRMADEVRNALADLIQMDRVRVRESDFWLEIEVQTDILFPTGVAVISENATEILTRLAEVLAPFPNPVRVEGHTDNIPIRTSRFPSNWELSAARAANVVRLFAERGVDPSRLAAVGMGQYRPIADNETPEGRNRNRRVLVVVLANDLSRERVEQARRVAGTENAESNAQNAQPPAGDPDAATGQARPDGAEEEQP